MNWIENQNNALNSLRSGLRSDCFESDFATRIDPCQNCKFFFCRIFRLDNVIGALFSEDVKQKNKQFRDCIKNRNKNIQGNLSPAISRLVWNNCNGISKLLNILGINKETEILEKLDKRLKDSFKVKTEKELIDTLQKLALKKIESNLDNNKSNLDEFQYYAFSRMSFGWANCDYFQGNENRTDIIVEVTTDKNSLSNANATILFNNRKTGNKANIITNDRIFFNSIPKDLKATIVALKYENGKAYLANKEIKTSNKIEQMEFKEYTMEQLKLELKKLD